MQSEKQKGKNTYTRGSGDTLYPLPLPCCCALRTRNCCHLSLPPFSPFSISWFMKPWSSVASRVHPRSNFALSGFWNAISELGWGGRCCRSALVGMQSSREMHERFHFSSCSCLQPMHRQCLPRDQIMVCWSKCNIELWFANHLQTLAAKLGFLPSCNQGFICNDKPWCGSLPESSLRL